MIAYSGLITASDRVFIKQNKQTHDLRGISLEYSEIPTRITSDLDIGDPSREDVIRRIRDAVWDTGATCSAISESMAREIGLQPVDTGTIVTATGQMEVPVYMLDVHLTKDIVIRNLKVFGSPMQNRDVDFVIGMDIIFRGKLVIDSEDGDGVISFTMKKK